MIWGINESLVSHSVENPITINTREKIESIIENSLKLLFKWMMMETPGLERTLPSDLVSNDPKEWHQHILDWLSSTSD